ncbi:Hypothetical protein PHPALM_16643, partial [Phytophthora palmivora]
ATGEDRTKTLRSVKNSFDSRLLEWLCKFEWGTSVETVTEDRIVKELDKIVGNVMNDAIIDVDSLFKSGLKIDLREKDVKARVVKYFMKCDEIILQHGLQSTFSTLTGIKEKCKILKQYLEPTALRDAVDSHRRLVDSASKADEQQLYLLVKEKALEQEKVFQLLSKRKKQMIDASKRSIQDQVRKQRTDSSRANPTRGTRGDYNHRRIVATATGSDNNILSRRHADKLSQLDKTVYFIKLSEPIESQAVGGAVFTSTHAIDVDITLNTAAGPVRCQDLKRCLIVEADENEVLIGKPLLTELGIDVDRQLEYLASRVDDDDTFVEP